MRCLHAEVRCLNPYDLIRKFLCADCERAYTCDCDRHIGESFLPHQIQMAYEYGTNAPYAIEGFASGICPECRGMPLEPYPKAHGGKVARFYWREIFKTKCQLIEKWLTANGKHVPTMIEFRRQFPQVDKELGKEAGRTWQRLHKISPRYNVEEMTEAQFLKSCALPIHDIDGSYSQVDHDGQRIGKWQGAKGELLRVEEFAAEHYRSDGYTVIHAEGVLVSCWIATLMWSVIQDPSDPRQQKCVRMSTRGWPNERPNAPILSFLLPADFGSADYYNRRGEILENAISDLEAEKDLLTRYDSALAPGESLRDYLWVNEDRCVEAARTAVEVLPREHVIASLRWVLKDFNARRAGWPDLLVFRDEEYRFVEVKSPHDKLSHDQMRWFRWALDEAGISCILARVKRK